MDFQSQFKIDTLSRQTRPLRVLGGLVCGYLEAGAYTRALVYWNTKFLKALRLHYQQSSRLLLLVFLYCSSPEQPDRSAE